MPSGRSATIGGLPERIHELVRTARRGVMTTIDPDGSPHSVPVVYAVVGDEIVSPIDHKPKSGRLLMRVKNLQRDHRVTLLVDVWDEDWPKLGWCMVRGQAVIDPSAPAELMRAINARYAQYQPDEIHDALIRIRPTKLSWWTYTSE